MCLYDFFKVGCVACHTGSRRHCDRSMQGNEKCNSSCFPKCTTQVVSLAHHEKIPEKLQGYIQYKEIKRAIKTVYESTNVDDFLSSCQILEIRLS